MPAEARSTPRFSAFGGGRRPYLVACLVAAVLGVSACATGPPPPLMLPLSEAETYGYSERTLDDGRREVSFLGPSRLVSSFESSRREELEQARDEAHDLALWRGAQLALDADRDGFAVVDTETEIRVDRVERGFHDPFFPFGFHHGHGFRRHHFHHFHHFPHGSYRRTTAQARVALVIDLDAERSEDFVDAAETVKRMEARYSRAAPR